MLGEYLVPPIIDFGVFSREADDDIVHPEYAEDCSAVVSRRLRGKSSRLSGVSNEDNGATSTNNEAFRTREAANEGQTSIKDETFRTREASDDKAFRTREASDEDNGSTSAADFAANNEAFRTREASDEDNGSTSAENDRKAPDDHESDNPNVETWPNDLIGIIDRITRLSISKMDDHEFKFELSSEAADKNASVLFGKYSGNLSDAIDANSRSTLGYGSEFRPIEVIAEIYKNHPVWDRMKNILSRGSDWPLDPIEEEQRVADVDEALSFGNHKGAKDRSNELADLVEKDVRFGYALPLPLRVAKELPGALFAPMNIMDQNSIDECGKIVEKMRLTHDQSYVFGGSKTSVNSRTRKDELLPCMYGACLRRLINWAIAARRRFPGVPIYASKVDFKSAYRRCHLSARTAIQCCTQLPSSNGDDLMLVYLRETFGGSPSPNEWGALAEPICDLANVVMHDDDWNPRDLRSPIQHLVPTPITLDSDIPFGEGRELIVNIPINPRGINDVYVDDIIPLTVGLPNTDNMLRCESAALLAIHATVRESHPDDPSPREFMESRAKLIAEAGLTELKTVLGWVLDFRRLIISLPYNKYHAWSNNIREILSRDNSTARELETLVGRLGHVGTIIPMVYHFLSRLRELQRKASRNKRWPTKLNAECRLDLRLMLQVLAKASRGIDMNIVAYRRPSHVYRADSCPHGLGGYSSEGYAWRFKVPDDLLFRASNNFLEFIASIVTPWVDLIAGRLRAGDCALSMTDSTTSAGWLKKTNFKEENDIESNNIEAKVRNEAARKHASLFIDGGVMEYTQWFEGESNNVSDSLSRDFHINDNELTLLLRSLYPDQLPPHFEIVQLPKEISSWMTSLLSKLPVKEQLREVHMKAKHALGRDGSITSKRSDSKMILSSTNSTKANAITSCAALPWLCVKDDFRNHLMDAWLTAQSAVPFRMFARPSGRIVDPTLQRTKIYNLASFYNDYTEHSKTRILRKNNKRQSLRASSPN